ncbi:hypothetical protein ACTXT7_007025 [Hymenolepis weldensis]
MSDISWKESSAFKFFIKVKLKANKVNANVIQMRPLIFPYLLSAQKKIQPASEDSRMLSRSSNSKLYRLQSIFIVKLTKIAYAN